MRIFPSFYLLLIGLVAGAVIAAGIDHGVWPVTAFGVIMLLGSMVAAYLEWLNDLYDQDERNHAADEAMRAAYMGDQHPFYAPNLAADIINSTPNKEDSK